MARFAFVYLTGLALLTGTMCQACEEMFDKYGTHEIVALAQVDDNYQPPDKGGPGTTVGTGTRFTERGSGR